jgi:hypothetical protein
MVNSALLIHLHSVGWYDNAALVLLRTALELAARGGFIALGVGNEATRWTEGPKLGTEEEQDAAEALFSAANCCAKIAPMLKHREVTSADPYAVYQWLCRFTHFDYKAFEMNHDASDDHISHEHAYAALAYVAWVCAVIAEVVVGDSTIARWPAVWPAKLQW